MMLVPVVPAPSASASPSAAPSPTASPTASPTSTATVAPTAAPDGVPFVVLHPQQFTSFGVALVLIVMLLAASLVAQLRRPLA